MTIPTKNAAVAKKIIFSVFMKKLQNRHKRTPLKMGFHAIKIIFSETMHT